MRGVVVATCNLSLCKWVQRTLWKHRFSWASSYCKILFFVVCWICCTQITCCFISSSVGYQRILAVCTSLSLSVLGSVVQELGFWKTACFVVKKLEWSIICNSFSIFASVSLCSFCWVHFFCALCLRIVSAYSDFSSMNCFQWSFRAWGNATKTWVTDFAYWFDQNFQQIILYLLHHPHCQELMMMKSMGSYGRLSMLFVLQVMMVRQFLIRSLLLSLPCDPLNCCSGEISLQFYR